MIGNFVISCAGFILALFLMLFIGAPLIRSLKQLPGAKWAPREDTPDSHLQKAGVPSMGGIGIIGAALTSWLLVTVGTLALEFYETQSIGFRILINMLGLFFCFMVLFPLVVFGYAILGYIDDKSKARSHGGISSKAKLLGQTLLAVGLLAGLEMINALLKSHRSGIADFPLIGVWWFYPVALLVIIGSSNAVNLTDGIDGLVAGLSTQVAIAFMVSSWGSSIIVSMSVANFWLCLGGACLGFLAFNKYPAKVFMGDTGSLALGAALGAGAILTRTVWLLPFIGFIFFVEMFSVIFQVLYFKWTKKRIGEGKRIFRRAPLHHHFELGGWSEWRVVGTFWAVNLVTSIIGLVLWKMGVLPRFP